MQHLSLGQLYDQLGSTVLVITVNRSCLYLTAVHPWKQHSNQDATGAADEIRSFPKMGFLACLGLLLGAVVALCVGEKIVMPAGLVHAAQ